MTIDPYNYKNPSMDEELPTQEEYEFVKRLEAQQRAERGLPPEPWPPYEDAMDALLHP